MAKENLQRLMEEAPRGQPLDPDMLRDMRISPRATSYLVDAGWLQRLSKGAYLLRGDTPTREGILAFISRKVPGLHVAGRSALRWHAFGSLPSSERIVLWGPRPYKFPPWVAEHLDFTYQTTALFGCDLPYEQGLHPASLDPGVTVSGTERALLEVASDAGKSMTMEELNRCLDITGEICISVLHQFLAHCTRVKVIKLIRDLGERGGFPWANAAQERVDQLGPDRRWSYISRNGERLTLK